MQSIVPPGQSGANGGSASNPTASTSYSSALAASMAQQQQSQSKHSQQSQVQIPTAADISLLLSLGMGGLDASQLANLDLQKLAMYLVSIHFEIRSTDNFQFSNFKFHFFQNSLKKMTKIFAFKLNQNKNWHKRKFNNFGDAF